MPSHLVRTHAGTRMRVRRTDPQKITPLSVTRTLLLLNTAKRIRTWVTEKDNDAAIVLG